MPIYLMPFDSVPALLGISSSFSQVFPALLIFSVIYIFFGILQPRGLSKIPVYELVLIFSILAYLLLITGINLLLGNSQNLTADILFKQFFALIGGLLIYLSFRITEITPQRLGVCVKWLLIILVPVVIYQVFFDQSDYIRVKGFSTEPSHFGNFLVFFALPALFLADQRGAIFFILLFLCNVFILLTVSITALVSASFFYVGWMLGSRALSFKRVSVACASLFLILGVAFSSNMNFDYLVSNASAFSSREAFVSAMAVSGSLVDRLYSFWGPAYGVLSGYVIFGGGVGGDITLLPNLIPSDKFDIIASVRSYPVGVSSFAGKVMTWGGIPLTVITVFIFFRLFWQASPQLKASVMPVLFSALFSMGALVVPYMWFWAAFLAQSNQRQKFFAGKVRS